MFSDFSLAIMLSVIFNENSYLYFCVHTSVGWKLEFREYIRVISTFS